MSRNSEQRTVPDGRRTVLVCLRTALVLCIFMRAANLAAELFAIAIAPVHQSLSQFVVPLCVATAVVCGALLLISAFVEKKASFAAWAVVSAVVSVVAITPLSDFLFAYLFWFAPALFGA